MKKIQTVKIEKLSNSGEGIARINNYVIFVENAIPEDIVEIEITKENKNFAKAKILKIKHPSSGRIKPFCALYNACGACSLQHANYDFQLKLKREITADAMKNIGNIDTKIEDIEPSPETKEFRCKIQYPIGQTKISKRFLAGYYKPKSHDIVNIKFCPIQPRICDEIIEFIRKKAQEYNLTCYNEKTGKGLLRHVVIRHSNYSKENLVTFVINANKISNTIKKFAQEIYNHFETITGVCANFNTIQNNVIMGAETQIICGNSVIEEKILDKTFKIGANTFFQINPKSAENIFKYVKETIKQSFQNPNVLDAYAGIASFGIIVSDVCNKVLSVESNIDSTKLAKEVAKLNKINNIEIHTTDTEKFMKNCTEKFDVIILDPPRKGCEKTTLDESIRLCNGKIIYVSCNPVTLARDLKYLKQKGATIESIKPFDMFCHTLHVENVAIINISKN